MEWQGHALLGLRAAEGLPEWEIALLKLDLSAEINSRSYIPKIKNVRDKLGAFCLILDWIYQKDFEVYARQANGKWIPHTPANRDYISSRGKDISFSANTEILADMLRNMIRELRAGNWEEAVRRAGILGHFVQEPFTPGHSFDNRLFQELFPDPDPDPDRNIKLHWAFDCASGDFAPPEARLLGVTVEEAANNLFAEMYRGMRNGFRYIAPVIHSVYRGESQDVRKDLLKKQSEHAARATASAWHTAFCIAFGRFDPDEANALDGIGLNSFDPYDFHLNITDNLTFNHLTDTDGRKIPITVFTRENGVPGERSFADGFGLYGHAGVKYFLNGVYSVFRCGIAMPSRMKRGQDEHALLDFSVETDEVENMVYSEDIRYNGKKVYREKMRAGTPLKWIEVDIRNAKTMILSSRAASWTDSGGTVRFSVPDLAIIEPKLFK